MKLNREKTLTLTNEEYGVIDNKVTKEGLRIGDVFIEELKNNGISIDDALSIALTGDQVEEYFDIYSELIRIISPNLETLKKRMGDCRES